MISSKSKIKVDEQGSEAAAITEVSTGAIFFIGQYTGK